MAIINNITEVLHRIRVKLYPNYLPNASRIIGISPNSGYSRNRIEVRTQYSGSGGTLLKTVRVITSGFILEHA